MNPRRNSRYVCVRNPPVLFKSDYGSNGVSSFPSPKNDWWCGEWKPKSFIKMWPDNLIDEIK